MKCVFYLINFFIIRVVVYGEWVLDFSDEFNESELSQNWRIHNSDGFNSTNVNVMNGSLVLTINEKSLNNETINTGSYVQTKYKVWNSGLFEIRVKLPQLQTNLLSQIVLIHQKPHPLSISYYPEITLFEFNNETAVITTIPNQFPGFKQHFNQNLNNEWINLKFVWNQQSINYYFNEYNYSNLSLNEHLDLKQGIDYNKIIELFRNVFFIGFRLKSYDSKQKIQSSDNSYFCIDYIRVYNWIDEGQINAINASNDLVWFDEFNHNEFNLTKWYIGSDETSDASNIRVHNGYLQISLNKIEGTYKGASIYQSYAQWNKAKFEVRVRFPSGDESEVWIYLQPVYGSDGKGSYISIADYSYFHLYTIDSGLYTGGTSYYFGILKKLESKDNETFHIFTMDWIEDKIIWRLNGEVYNIENLDRYFLLNDNSLYKQMKAPFEKNFHLVISLLPKHQNISNQTSILYIDYIRVYKSTENSVNQLSDTHLLSANNNALIYILMSICLLLILIIVIYITLKVHRKRTNESHSIPVENFYDTISYEKKHQNEDENDYENLENNYENLENNYEQTDYSNEEYADAQSDEKYLQVL